MSNRLDPDDSVDSFNPFAESSPLGGITLVAQAASPPSLGQTEPPSSNVYPGLAPPDDASGRGRLSSPRATSPAVGTIGGHRSPALSASASPHRTRNSTIDTRPGSLSSSPRASLHFGLGFGNGGEGTGFGSDAAFAGFHSFRSSSPSFASAMSHQSTGRMSPWQERGAPSLQQVMDQRFGTGGTSSPAERPASRLDVSKLQQRSNAAAAAAAATAAVTGAANHTAAHQARGASSATNMRGQTQLGQRPAGLPETPLLVQPRPEMPGRNFSDGSAGVNAISAALDQLTPLSPTGRGRVPSTGQHSLMSASSDKVDEYPFPTSQPMHMGAALAVDRFQHNSSRSSFRGSGQSRVASPLHNNEGSRFRMSSVGESPSSKQIAGGASEQETQRRLGGLEVAMEDLMKGLTSVARNVGWLMEREQERERSGAVMGGGQGMPASQDTMVQPSGNVRALSQQLNVLSGSVQQLMSLQQQQQQQQRASHNAPGRVTPQPHQQTQQQAAPPLSVLAYNNNNGAGQTQSGAYGSMGPPATIPNTQGSVLQAGGFDALMPPLGPPPMPDMRGPSPRPSSMARPSSRTNWLGPNGTPAEQQHRGGGGQSGGAGDRRWTSNMSQQNSSGGSRRESLARNPNAIPLGTGSGPGPNPGTAQESHAPTAGGGVGPLEANVVITKWDHLNLQPDLLRSVLKYGLGPPNKIQQRALPFLLRGSDIIAQAPPTQERIASYVIPGIQTVLNALRSPPLAGSPLASSAGPFVIMVTTTVDQATQAQRMTLGLGSQLGIRVQLSAGGPSDAHAEAQTVLQNRPHVIVGTPSRMSDLVTRLANLQGPNGIPLLTDIRMVILDEVDQMIARNLSDHVSTLLRVLPSSTSAAGLQTLAAQNGADGPSPAVSPGLPATSSGAFNPFNRPQSTPPERQTAIFSNTVPQDVLNFAQSIHLRESVRVLVRREGTSVTQHPPSNGASMTSTGGNVNGAGVSGEALGSTGFSGAPYGQASMAGLPKNPMPTNVLQPNAMHPNPRQDASGQSDASMAAIRSLRQYYLYLAVTDSKPSMSSHGGFGASSNSEMKLDVMADLLEDMEFGQAVVYTGSASALEAVTYKLSSRGIEALALHKDMANSTRQQILNSFRSPVSSFRNNANGGGGGNAAGGRQRKVLVACEVSIQPREVHQVPLIVFYDMPRTVEEYKSKLACGASGGMMARPSVCINIVTPGQQGSSGGRGSHKGGDIEMLKTIENHLGCKMVELPIDAKGILNF